MIYRLFILAFLLISPSSQALSLWSCASRLVYRTSAETPVPVSIRFFDSQEKLFEFDGKIQLVRYESRHLLGLQTVYEYRVVEGQCPRPIRDALNAMARGWYVTRRVKQQTYLGPGRGYARDYTFVEDRITNQSFESALLYSKHTRRENGEKIELERHRILMELHDRPDTTNGLPLTWMTWLDTTPVRPDQGALLARANDIAEGFPEGESSHIRVRAPYAIPEE